MDRISIVFILVFPSVQAGAPTVLSAFGIGKDYDRVKNYVDTLVYEIQELRGLWREMAYTVYIGGGTPTSLRVEDLRDYYYSKGYL